MADELTIPKYLVDGVLSVFTHNGVHRIVFHELQGINPHPCVELAIPVSVLPTILDAIKTSLPVK
jgi:hypothetical protein